MNSRTADSHATLRTSTIALIATALLGACTEPRAPKSPQVEIQIGLCGEPAMIETALALRARGEPMQVWLFDDPDLAMFAKGLRFRLRVSGGHSELTVKVANQDCNALPLEVAHDDGKCEYDVHGETLSGAVSLTRAIVAAQTREVLSGRLALAGVMSPAQVGYLRDVVNLWPLPADIRGLGPIEVQRYRGKPYDVDISTLPDGTRYVEISRKVALVDAPRARENLEADLVRAGVTACADQSAQAEKKLRSLLVTSPG
jgi:hypothetical protein